MTSSGYYVVNVVMHSQFMVQWLSVRWSFAKMKVFLIKKIKKRGLMETGILLSLTKSSKEKSYRICHAFCT